MTDLILYTTEDGKSRIQLRADEQTVWLTQLEMADLFDATKQNISLHLKNLYLDGELDAVATVKESLTVQIEGGREIRRPVVLYNLDAILAVGYRVRSPRGVQFRRWAGTVLKESRPSKNRCVARCITSSSPRTFGTASPTWPAPRTASC
ncbi:MAG TPA: RhuM family protein [Candidatus Sulfotelmatobacter sp.]|nr:RhuM family protein [Candidatus Sulfotelmatobacter sp.]